MGEEVGGLRVGPAMDGPRGGGGGHRTRENQKADRGTGEQWRTFGESGGRQRPQPI